MRKTKGAGRGQHKSCSFMCCSITLSLDPPKTTRLEMRSQTTNVTNYGVERPTRSEVRQGRSHSLALGGHTPPPPPKFFIFFKIVGTIEVYLEFEPIETKLWPPYSFFDPLNPKNSPNNNHKN